MEVTIKTKGWFDNDGMRTRHLVFSANGQGYAIVEETENNDPSHLIYKYLEDGLSDKHDLQATNEN
jgi:hypothetical protein